MSWSVQPILWRASAQENRKPIGFFLSNLVACEKMNNGGVSVYSPKATSFGFGAHDTLWSKEPIYG